MKSLVRIVFTLALLLAASVARASFPLVRNFSRHAHSGGTQTWAIARDAHGEMYFGNKNGLLSYDSDTWRLRGVENGSTVRALLIDQDDSNIYVGASEEFGVFRPDSITGDLRYFNLSAAITRDIPSFKEIWKILKPYRGPDIWFLGNYDIFHYDGRNITVIHCDERITASAAANGRIYVATAHGSISEVRGNSLRLIVNDSRLEDDRICAILPYNNVLMLVTEYDGLFLLADDRVEKFSTDIEHFLTSNQVFCAGCSPDGRKYAFGTVGKGVVIKDFQSGLTTYSNVATGLQNNTVLTTYFDPDGNLWLGLDNGIDMVCVNAPYYSLLGSASRHGAGYHSLHKGDRLYLGTNQGLFSMKFPDENSPDPPTLNGILRGQVWDIDSIGNDIFICHDGGLNYLSGNSLHRVTLHPDSNDPLPGAWDLAPVFGHDDYALVSTYDSFYLLRKDGSRWICLGPVDGYNDIGGHFVQDSDGNIWITHWLKGAYRLTLDIPGRRFDSLRFYDSSAGLPTDRNVGVTIIDNRPVFTTEGGFFRYDSALDSLKPSASLNGIFGPAIAPRLHVAPNGDIWCYAGKTLSLASFNSAGNTSIDSLSFSPLADRLIPGFDNFNFVSDNTLIISAQDGFYEIKSGTPPIAADGCKVYFRSMEVTGDTSIIYSPRFLSSKVDVPYSLNSILFEVVAPEYRDERPVMYSFYLENYDNDWSQWTTSSAKEYTQLHEGNYTMHVKALNPFTRAIDERVLHFSVLPPWFRSVPAKIIYLFCIIILLWLSYKAIRSISLKASQKVAVRKERELETMRRRAKEESLLKDYEIAELKGRQLEQDVKHKTEELSNITMNVVRKNEILLDISERLDRIAQTDSPGEINRQVSRIKALIRENINHDEDWRTFRNNFDAAYEDFTKKLLERHPSLTPTELRLCCYLKMGLASKEIAPLFNISYRSVEMTRYRLRKKFEFTRDQSLTEYLQSFN